MSRVISLEYTGEGCRALAPGRGEDARPAPAEVGAAVLMSRLDCDLHILDVPPASPDRLRILLGYRIRALFPGRPEEAAFDYHLVRAKKTSRAVVAIARREVVQAYQDFARRRPIVLPFHLLAGKIPARGDCLALFWHPQWFELLFFRDGLPVESKSLRHQGSALRDLETIETLIPADWAGAARIAFRWPPEPAFDPGAGAAVGGSPGADYDAEPDSPEALLAEHPVFSRLWAPGRLDEAAPARGVFAPPAGGSLPRLFRREARVWILLIACLLLGGLVLNRAIGVQQSYVDRLKASFSDLERELGESLAARQELRSLEESYAALRAARPLDVYALFSDLSAVLGRRVEITRFVLQADRFQLDAVGRDSFALMERFERHPRFMEVRIIQTAPQEDGTERFSLSGGYRAR